MFRLDLNNILREKHQFKINFFQVPTETDQATTFDLTLNVLLKPFKSSLLGICTCRLKIVLCFFCYKRQGFAHAWFRAILRLTFCR